MTIMDNRGMAWRRRKWAPSDDPPADVTTRAGRRQGHKPTPKG